MPASAEETGNIPVVVPPSAELKLYLQCRENRVDDDYDGGLVLLTAIRGQLTDVGPQLIDARLVLSAKHDDFMRQFPVTRDEKQNTFFELTLRVVPYSAVPPDPDAASEPVVPPGARVDASGNLIEPRVS